MVQLCLRVTRKSITLFFLKSRLLILWVLNPPMLGAPQPHYIYTIYFFVNLSDTLQQLIPTLCIPLFFSPVINNQEYCKSTWRNPCRVPSTTFHYDELTKGERRRNLPGMSRCQRLLRHARDDLDPNFHRVRGLVSSGSFSFRRRENVTSER